MAAFGRTPHQQRQSRAFLVAGLLLLLPCPARAEGEKRAPKEPAAKEAEPVAETKGGADAKSSDQRAMLKNPLSRLSIFDGVDKGFATGQGFFPDAVHEVKQLPNDEQPGTSPVAAREKKSEFDVRAQGEQGKKDAANNSVEEAATDGLPQNPELKGPVFVGKFKAKDILPPDQTPRVRLNDEAPSPFVAMAIASMNGDKALAEKYADQWVRYQQNVFFEVRNLTRLVGEALIRNNQIDEDDWYGVPQMIDYELARTRKETHALIKPGQDDAMRQIVPDEKGEAAVFYFFTLSCAHCREMNANVERLNQAFKRDPKIKMAALTLGPVPQEWMTEFRNYTGLTLKAYNGEKIARSFNVRFTPALVVVAPNGKRAYVKTGEQSFERMYEFVRTVQGLPGKQLTAEAQVAAKLKIGSIENAKVTLPTGYEKWIRDDDLRAVRSRMRDRTVAAAGGEGQQQGQQQGLNVKELRF